MFWWLVSGVFTLLCVWVGSALFIRMELKRLKSAAEEAIEEVHASAASRSGEIEFAASLIEARTVEALKRVQAKAEKLETEIEKMQWRCPCYATRCPEDEKKN